MNPSVLHGSRARAQDITVSPDRRVLVQCRPLAPIAPSSAAGVSASTGEGALPAALAEEARRLGLEQGLAEAATRIDAQLAAVRLSLERAEQEREAGRDAEHRERMDRLDACVRALQAGERHRIVQLEDEAVELAFAALCRILGTHDGHRQRAVEAVGEALGRMGRRDLLEIRLNPVEWAWLQGDDTGRALMRAHPQVSWKADPMVGARECRIGTRRGSLEVGLSTQLEQLRSLWAADVPAGSGSEGGDVEA